MPILVHSNSFLITLTDFLFGFLTDYIYARAFQVFFYCFRAFEILKEVLAPPLLVLIKI